MTINQLIFKLLMEEVEKNSYYSLTPQYIRNFKMEVFRKITGISAWVEQTPLSTAINETIEMIVDLQESIGELSDTLREEIVEKYNTQEYWDNESINEYISNTLPAEMLENNEDILSKLTKTLVEKYNK